jgi:microcystin-dependent protein
MEPFLGEIRLLPYSFVPVGWAACDGRLLSISQNTALFSLLGTSFGGDGRTNFALPDLRHHTPLSSGQGGYCIALQGIYPSRA